MNTQRLLFLLFFVGIGNLFSQEKTINDYQYFIVNSRFNFLKERDQYQTSSLTKFLFNQAGFITYLNDDKLPSELQNNRCKALFIEVDDVSGMLSIKNQIIIKDCSGVEIFKSEEGSSKIKNYQRGYYDAIKKAFESVKSLNYSYKPSTIKVNDTLKEIDQGKKLAPNSKETAALLYAQPKPYGFQLVNLTPEIVFHILKTAVANVFIIKDKNGILYLKNGIWFAEYYQNGKMVMKQYQIKF